MGKNSQVLETTRSPEAQALLKQANDEYFHWDQLFHMELPKGFKHEIVWAIIKLFRNTNYQEILLPFLARTRLKYQLTGQIIERLHEIDTHASMTVESNTSLTGLQGENKDYYLINSLMEEAIASSQLEGAATTRKVAKEMLRTGRKPRNESEKMITNNYHSIKFIVDSVKDKNHLLTPEFIQKIHKMVTNDTLEGKEFEGAFRITDDIVVLDQATQEVMYTPPLAAIVPKAVQDICTFANRKDDPYIHPLIKAIILHFLIGYVHPFVDGNGRTARALFYWYCLKNDYWLFQFTSISRILKQAPSQYQKAYLYTETDEMDLNYFLNFNLDSTHRAMIELKSYINQKQKEIREATRIIQKVPNINLRQSLLLKEIIKHPDKIFTIQEIQNTHNVVYQTARTDLDHLTEKGFLEKKLTGKKFIYYKSAQFDRKLKEILETK
ncbi:MAG: Fic family protein [Candidatus Diapherotrites archaeon]